MIIENNFIIMGQFHLQVNFTEVYLQTSYMHPTCPNPASLNPSQMWQIREPREKGREETWFAVLSLSVLIPCDKRCIFNLFHNMGWNCRSGNPTSKARHSRHRM